MRLPPCRLSDLSPAALRLSLLALAACTRVETAADRLVIVVLDGTPVHASFGEEGVLPELEAMAEEGVRVEGAVNASVPLTVESHVELMSGRRQQLGNFSPGDYGNWRSDVPTLFELVAEARQLARGQTVAMGNTVLLAEAFASRYPGYGYGFGPDFEPVMAGEFYAEDARVIGAVADRLAAEDVYALLANVHLVDATAHGGGDYIGELSRLGQPLQELWAWIEANPPYAGHTDLVVLADHGRHEWGVEDDWMNHGDQCNGCRAIPMVLLGPSFAQARTVTRSVTLADLSASLAELMGVALPYGDGVVIPEVFRASVEAPERGALTTGISDGHRAVQRWSAAEGTHTEVLVDDAVVSSPGALLAERPVLLGDVACWRELTLTPDEMESRWAGRCLEDGTELALPERAGSAAWSPVLRSDVFGYGFWLLDTSNYEGWPGSSAIRPRLMQWSDGWSTDPDAGPEVAYPTDLDLLMSTGGARVSFGASADADDGRDTREIQVWDVLGSTDQTWTQVAVLPPPEGSGRVDRASLRYTEAGWQIAALAWPLAGGVTVVISTDTGGGFGVWEQVEPGSNALGHIRPTWADDGALWWARRDDSVIEACRLADTLTCTPVEADALDSIVLDGADAWMNVASGWTWRTEAW